MTEQLKKSYARTRLVNTKLRQEVELLRLAWMIQLQTDCECDGNEKPGEACQPNCMCQQEIDQYLKIAKGRMR